MTFSDKTASPTNKKQTRAFFGNGRKESSQPFFQPKLTIGPVDDQFEREADAVADSVMRMSDPESIQAKISPVTIQRKCTACNEEEELQRKEDGTGEEQTEAPSIVSDALGSGGNPLDDQSRSFMESRFGYDFNNVRIHTDTIAAKSAQSINALAYTSGNSIVFNQGQYSPGTESGKKLLAHELTHVVQQNGMTHRKIQRTSSFCTPYATATEAADAEWWIRNTYMRAEGVETFGTEVYNLYDSFLNRRPGDSLSPRIFSNSTSYIHNCFKDDGAIKDDMDTILDLVGARLHLAPAGSLRDGVEATMSLSNFLSHTEMENRFIDFSNPFAVSGHIAGGLGSSDAGIDYRKITSANVSITKVVLAGNTGYHLIELIPHYEVFDAIDFCPGNIGAVFEQAVTIPMSRLEATGEAYDMPFKVIFSPEPRSSRYWF